MSSLLNKNLLLLLTLWFGLALARPLLAQELPPPSSAFPHSQRPEAPLLMHQVHEVDVSRNEKGKIKRTDPQFYRSLRPAFPPARLSHDGRLGFHWANLGLYLLSPEKVKKPFLLSEAGLNILTTVNPVFSRATEFLSKPSDPTPNGFAGITLCHHQRGWQQPRKCGANDCYDVTYVGFRLFRSPNNYKNTFDLGFFRSRQVTIEVENPKTPKARIKAINAVPGQEVREKVQPIEVEFDQTDASFMSFEPTTTADGHLYVSRFSLLPIKNLDGNVSTPIKVADIYYMISPESAVPCDASAFSYARRLTRAHSDPDMKNQATGTYRYGIAEYPMKDSTGRLMPEDAVLQTYPWIDNKGNNLFFSTGGSTL